ncbi:lysophospholipid acyltransferase family protein [Nocardia puris]|uniref:Lyso-ornithine lipid acyltransferase n=1 Tax=Nocardia puris TaxID=208602 RepID=A0A366E626_9NOCA|nr:lysophospholipid acyltransferase family protein [Nocardia puris]RBO96954.1 lyso-ornithine lipid acyltransferase [Nocardia puris]
MVFDAPPAQAVHAWMPSSPCGPGCIEPTDEIGTAGVVVRALGVAGLLLTYPVGHLATPAAHREELQRKYARVLLRCMGMRLRVVDNRVPTEPVPAERAVAARIGAERAANAAARYADTGTGVLVVTGHVGWSDVVALAAVQPLGFVARADLIDWPVLGALARLMRVIPIERERLRALPGIVEQIADRLAAGERVAVFPEGTTWCGRAYGSMRPALFQAAIDTGTYVQPVRLRYLDRHGTQCTVPGFVGEDSFGDSAGRIFRSRGITVEIVLEAPEYPGTDRRDLARRCERAVRGAGRPRHGRDSATWIEATTTRVQDPAPVDAAVPDPPMPARPGLHRRALAVLRGRSHGAA